MSDKYDFLIFIGRFQPFHDGHCFIVKRALELSSTVIVLCGSSNRPRSLRHPWFYSERVEMIRSCFSAADNSRIIIAPLYDVTYNDSVWITRVHNAINDLITTAAVADTGDDKFKIGVIGHLKDDTSYYLRLFPHWGLVAEENYKGINSTDLRELFFYHRCSLDEIRDRIPESVVHYLEQFKITDDYTYVTKEYDCVRKFQQRWSGTPYLPFFVTVNAVVVRSGHILIIKRQRSPGKGLMALPGGFIEQREYLLDACLRKLREETGLNLAETLLKASIQNKEVFDSPSRSERGRTISHVFYFSLPNEVSLADVGVEASEVDAFWLPLANLNSVKMFEDHYFIIQKIVGMT